MELEEFSGAESVLVEIGNRLKNLRAGENLTQGDVAVKSGVSKTTVERLEKGHAVGTDAFVKILSVLGLISKLGIAIPVQTLSPIDEVEKKKSLPVRASKKRRAAKAPAWKWGDEE